MMDMFNMAQASNQIQQHTKNLTYKIHIAGQIAYKVTV